MIQAGIARRARQGEGDGTASLLLSSLQEISEERLILPFLSASSQRSHLGHQRSCFHFRKRRPPDGDQKSWRAHRDNVFFDPEQVKGKITLLSPKKISSEETLKLLQSALALHGYTLLKKEEGTWVVPAEKVTQTETIIAVIPLKYARAAEVADTLSWVAPPGVRIAPYYPTNSLIISGNPQAVEELIGVVKEKEKRAEGQ